MRIRYTVTLILVSAMALVSCTKESRELQYTNQESKIESFVQKRQADDPQTRVVHNGGATRVVVSEGTGIELTARGRVTIYYAGYNFSSGSVSNSTLFATNSRDFASSAGWKLTDESVFEVLEMDLTDKDILRGLRDGLEGVREGEECYILFSGKYAFGKSKIGTIPANSPLAFRVWVQQVEN